jgi:DNA helicase-2/ATP-dependent DNA helicase PcrA
MSDATDGQRDVYEQEQAKLHQVICEMEQQLEKLEQIPRYYGDDLVEQALDDLREQRRRTLRTALPEPYFGRLDFQETGSDGPRALYIGKRGIQDEETGDVLVVDWRAPVASLFYSFTGQTDTASYESPDGTVEGIVHLKRNLAIRQQTLQRVVDSYVRGEENLGVADEFLLYRLAEHKDHRLRDIVATIQAEQDRIIRADRNQAMVIQGVAGSGKTTAALHRLAYLLYQYQDRMRPDKVVIFAPNAMFLDYISDVLPELGVGDIRQTTFEAWAVHLLDEQVEVRDPSERWRAWFDAGAAQWQRADDVTQWKGSAAFRDHLATELADYEKNCVPDLDLEAWPGCRLEAPTIRTWFLEEYRHLPIAERRGRVLARIKRWIETEHKAIRDEDRKGERRKQALKRLKAYEKQWPEPTPIGFYTAVLNRLRDEWPDAGKSIERRGKRLVVAYEDLAPLVFLRDRLYGIDSAERFDHVVIDEAQDFSPFQVLVLRDHCPGSSFTILGDLSQSIYAFQGIHSWDQFLELFPEDQRGFYRLDRSYRSTMEIIHFANAVLRHGDEGLTLATPVFRSGDPVRVRAVPAEKRVHAVEDAIAELKGRGADTIAVVTRSDTDAEQLHAALSTAGIEANRIDPGQTDYRGGVSVLPIYLSKGLEFDAVILTDVDAEHYPLSALDAKLLYVGCTRALHWLQIVYSGDPSPLIADIESELYRAS